jgi:hypothetical protein
MLPEHREKLEQQRTLYRDTKEVGETQRTLATAPAVAAEHVHHHVHETIQPVVQKQTIEPHVRFPLYYPPTPPKSPSPPISSSNKHLTDVMM